MLLIAALTTVVYGPERLHQFVPGLGPFYLCKAAEWPTAALLLIVALLCLDHFAPNVQEQKWKLLLPGSIVAALIRVAVSVLFKLYVYHFNDFGLLYGSLGAFIILMFWFYPSERHCDPGGRRNQCHPGRCRRQAQRTGSQAARPALADSTTCLKCR